MVAEFPEAARTVEVVNERERAKQPEPTAGPPATIRDMFGPIKLQGGRRSFHFFKQAPAFFIDHLPSSDCVSSVSAASRNRTCAVPRLRKLPPSPSRSLGGYLDYEGWPDRERFMELDRALQHAADEVLGKLFMELGPMTFAQRFEFRNVASTVQQAGCAPLADSPRAARPRPF